MPTLFFPERDTLRSVLATGGVAASVSGSPAAAGFDEQGRLWLNTSAWLSRETLVLLSRYGVRVMGAGGARATEKTSCWHELLSLEPVAATPDLFSGPVLFDLPGRWFAALAGEIERIAGRPYSYAWSNDLDEDLEEDRVLIKVSAPPYCTLLRVLETSDPKQQIRAYTEQAENVWVAAGFRHPLAEQIKPPEGKLLFLHPPRRWERRDARPFVASSELAGGTQISTRDQSTIASASTDPPIARAALRLRLIPSDDDSPAELWLIPEGGIEWLDQYVRSADEYLLNRFSFAVVRDADRSPIILRSHVSAESPPILVGPLIEYRPLMKLANLWVPRGYRMTPMPRRDALRRILSPDNKRLTWLRLSENGAFHPESLPLTAFRPLREWIEYSVEEPSRVGRPWQPSATWNFERFGIAMPAARTAQIKPPQKPIATPATPADKKLETTKKRGLLGRALDWLTRGKETSSLEPVESGLAAPIIPSEAKPTASRISPSRISPDRPFTPAKVNEGREKVKALKARFFPALAKLTSEDRLFFWPEFAKAFTDSTSASEAGICWLNALWEQEKPSPGWALNWLDAEAEQIGGELPGDSLAEWLSAKQDPARVRAMAAYVVWATTQEPVPADVATHSGEIQAYLEAGENALPLRAAWLARTGLAKLTRGDVLTLARTRDRLFARLMQKGLGLDLDTPAFARWAESDDSDRFEQLGKWLIARRDSIHHWIELHDSVKFSNSLELVSIESFGIEAELNYTKAYADLMLAWALARLGEKTEGARLREQAGQMLGDKDPIHAWLKSAFDIRIRQALEGKDSGLPPEMYAQLEAMPDDDRYRIDRLRQSSKILDPTGRVDAYWASTMRHYRHWNELSKQLIELPGLAPAAVKERVKQLLAKAADQPGAALPTIMLHTLDLAPQIDRSLGERILEQIPAALDLVANKPALQMRLLEKGLLFAASFDRASAVQPLFQRFVAFVEKQRGQPTTENLEGLTSQMFRCLRRLGMKREAYEMLGQVHYFLTGGQDISALKSKMPKDWPNLMRVLLRLAAAYSYCHQEELADRMIRDIGQELYHGSMSQAERTALALTFASILGDLQLPSAKVRFEELFLNLKRVSVNGWNSHYTRQPLEVIDTALLAVVGEDFRLGPSVRGWLDDEEFLIRQRINKDLQELMGQQGI